MVHWSIGPLVHWSIGPLVECQMSNVKCQMPNVNKVYLLLERTSGAPPDIFMKDTRMTSFKSVHWCLVLFGANIITGTSVC